MIFFINPSKVIPLIDLTSLPPEETKENIKSLCAQTETRFGSVASVCIWPAFIKLAKSDLKGKKVSIATVLNFPKGEESEESVLKNLQKAIKEGADEIDVVFPYKKWLEGNKDEALSLIQMCREKAPKKILKVIMETGEMKRTLQIMEAAKALLELKVDFLKTSTGKTEIGATLEAANALLDVLAETKSDAGIKISGGIQTMEQVSQYVALAENVMGKDWLTPNHFRIGASSLLHNILMLNQKA
ncbi:MAG: deoxyribose-phosphate aldolase [Alphaproteobacteria bacterium]|nr:deoxyribose-phosphate aldolase [Alphaproteobacteria bacterium]